MQLGHWEGLIVLGRKDPVALVAIQPLSHVEDLEPLGEAFLVRGVDTDKFHAHLVFRDPPHDGEFHLDREVLVRRMENQTQVGGIFEKAVVPDPAPARGEIDHLASAIDQIPGQGHGGSGGKALQLPVFHDRKVRSSVRLLRVSSA